MSEWVKWMSKGKAKKNQLKYPLGVSKYKYLPAYRYKYLLKNECFMLLTSKRIVIYYYDSLFLYRKEIRGDKG
jgi:hypothetical protein